MKVYNVRMPQELFEVIKTASELEMRSINQQMVIMLTEGIQSRKAWLSKHIAETAAQQIEKIAENEKENTKNEENEGNTLQTANEQNGTEESEN